MVQVCKDCCCFLFVFFVVVFSARAGQAIETVSVMKPDKVTRRTLTNYLNNKSNDPKEKKKRGFYCLK